MTDPTLPLEFHAGAGQIVSFPFYLSCSSRNEQDQPRHYKEQAYFVCPAAHIGRVVTGVILVSDKVSVSPEIMSHLPEGLAMEVLNKFGMSAISFADKLAEQGYKVLVVDLSSTSVVNSWRIDINSSTQDLVKIKIELLENASKFLKKDNDIQRVALMGVGNAGDVVLQASIDSASLADSAIVMCPNGSIPWKDPSSSSKNIIPTLVLIGDRNAYVHSTEVWN
jgi:dienelactone hydrolase